MPYQVCSPSRLIDGLSLKLASTIDPELVSPDARSGSMMIQHLLTHFHFMQEGYDAALAQHDRANAQLMKGRPEPTITEAIKDVFRTRNSAQLSLALGVIANFEAFHRTKLACTDLAGLRLAELKRVAFDVPQLFREYLSARIDKSVGEFASFRRVPGGFSKDTYIIELRAGDEVQGCRQIVLRMDSAGLPTGASVMDEFPLLKEFQQAGVPIAKPLWCESDPSHLGHPFQVSEFVQGIAASSSDESVALWGNDPVRRHDLGRQAAGALARLHAIIPAGEPYDPTAKARELVDHWQEFDRQYRDGSEPVIDLLYSWLRAHIPQTGERVSWIHGDFGPYNMLVNDGHVQAILDWELVHLGDPIEDLAYCRPFFQSVMPWSEFMACYREHGGIGYDLERARFYDVFRTVGIVAKIAKFRHCFQSGVNLDIKLLFPSIDMDRHFIQTALDIIKPDIDAPNT